MDTSEKGKLRRARKAARAAGEPLTGELALDPNRGPTEFSSDSAYRGRRARDRWARRYDDLNGAPESDYDR